MTQMAHRINKGVGKPVEFYGLRGIWMYSFFGGMAGLIFLYFVLASSGFPSLALLLLILTLAGMLWVYVFRMNEKHGEFGLLKLSAKKKMPSAIVIRNPHIFQNLKSSAK